MSLPKHSSRDQGCPDKENAHSRVAEGTLPLKQVRIKFKSPQKIMQQLYSCCGEKKQQQQSNMQTDISVKKWVN